ncbi:MAG: YeeE/YedE family protein, partial [Rhodospirillales bacterium]|nr:YeeE/YedE family protein [Rhodospirillales bacterium]
MIAAQRTVLMAGAGIAMLLFGAIMMDSPTRGLLFAIGLAMGVTLYHGAFGFSSAYRKLLSERDMTGVAAQIIMLIAAIILFAPILAQGSVFGHGVSGSVAPLGVAVGFGAFIFGIGMQLGSGCASGVLYTAGGGNVRTLLVLIFFCLGAFWGSLDLGWWQLLPSMNGVSLGQTFGWKIAAPLQIGVLVMILVGLHLSGWTMQPISQWRDGLSLTALLKGPWPLIVSAVALALLNWTTLLVAGHAWSITWAFTLWGAKAATLLGWDPATSGFWNGGFQQAALGRSILSDTTSIMNIAILLGAMLAAGMAGTFYKPMPRGRGPLLAAILAG